MIHSMIYTDIGDDEFTITKYFFTNFIPLFMIIYNTLNTPAVVMNPPRLESYQSRIIYIGIHASANVDVWVN